MGAKHLNQPRRTRPMQTVYPSTWAMGVVGHRPVTYNLAIECWAMLLAEATKENEGEFNKKEWEIIAETIRPFRFDSSNSSPSASIAELLRRPGQPHDVALMKRLADVVADFDFVHAWALIWACNFHEENPERKDWWTVEARTKVA